MKIRFHNLRRASWRQRFVAIAHQVEGAETAPLGLVIAAGLRAKAQAKAQAFQARVRAGAHYPA